MSMPWTYHLADQLIQDTGSSGLILSFILLLVYKVKYRIFYFTFKEEIEMLEASYL